MLIFHSLRQNQQKRFSQIWTNYSLGLKTVYDNHKFQSVFNETSTKQQHNHKIRGMESDKGLHRKERHKSVIKIG